MSETPVWEVSRVANTNAPSVPSQDAIIRSTPPQHFSIFYHDTLKLLLKTHNSLLRTYMALQTLGDGSRVTRSFVQAVMDAGFSGADYGTTAQEVLSCIQKLREMGFIWIMHKDDKPDEIFLMPFLNEQQKAKFQGRTNELPPPSAPVEQLKQEIDDFRAQNQSDPWEAQDEQKYEELAQQSSSRRRSAQSAVPARSSSLPAVNSLSPWWQGHQDHLKFLGAIHKDYPKKSNIKYALDAWEAIFSTGEEMTQDEQALIWNGLQWWYRYWIDNTTEEKFIPALSRFIEREQWLPEAIEEREQKDQARNRR